MGYSNPTTEKLQTVSQGVYEALVTLSGTYAVTEPARAMEHFMTSLFVTMNMARESGMRTDAEGLEGTLESFDKAVQAIREFQEYLRSTVVGRA